MNQNFGVFVQPFFFQLMISENISPSSCRAAFFFVITQTQNLNFYDQKQR